MSLWNSLQGQNTKTQSCLDHLFGDLVGFSETMEDRSLQVVTTVLSRLFSCIVLIQ